MAGLMCNINFFCCQKREKNELRLFQKCLTIEIVFGVLCFSLSAVSFLATFTAGMHFLHQQEIKPALVAPLFASSLASCLLSTFCCGLSSMVAIFLGSMKANTREMDDETFEIMDSEMSNDDKGIEEIESDVSTSHETLLKI